MDKSVERDSVSIRIDEMFLNFSNASSKPSIFRVHERLRKENEDAYEPQKISIGPHHRGKDRLRAMEYHKINFFRLVLHRNREGNADRYVTAMRKLEERARKCYENNIGLDSNEFVQMMVLDSCFIVEFVCKGREFLKDEPHERILITRDLMLLENQLPFFIVKAFMNLSMLGSYEDFIVMFLRCEALCTGALYRDVIRNGILLETVEHLLDFYYQSWVSFASTAETAGSSSTKNIKSVTELEEAGVQFKNDWGILFDVSFENGIMSFPTLSVDNCLVTLLLNLIAYEQCLPDLGGPYIKDYMLLLNCLVKTSKDVEILRQHEIITNHLSDDGAIAALINKMCNNVTSSRMSTYSALFEKVNKHRKPERNRQMEKWKLPSRQWKLLPRQWLAALWNKYNTPCAIISFLATVFLLFLTLAQTILAYRSFKERA